MKKLLAILAAIAMVGAFTTGAMAADWNFYGHARMATFWVSDDYGDSVNAAGDSNDDDLWWFVQGNSRIGATVKQDAVSGGFEYGTGVNLRKLYGEWDFGSGKLLAGQTYTPITVFYSDQVFDSDLGLLGYGNAYGSRRGMLQLTFGDFKIAGVQITGASNKGTGGDIDEFLPKIEAAYNAKFDAGTLDFFGGFQTFDVDTVANSIDVTSYMLGVGGTVNLGAGYLRGSVSWYQNGSDAAWSVGGVATGGATLGSSTLNAAGTDVDDVNSWMGMIIAGLKVSDMVAFQAGFGYVESDYDAPNTDNVAEWMVYLQSTLSVAPMVDIIPEIGYWDRGDNAANVDQGNRFYLGARWRIRF